LVSESESASEAPASKQVRRRRRSTSRDGSVSESESEAGVPVSKQVKSRNTKRNQRRRQGEKRRKELLKEITRKNEVLKDGEENRKHQVASMSVIIGAQDEVIRSQLSKIAALETVPVSNFLYTHGGSSSSTQNPWAIVDNLAVPGVSAEPTTPWMTGPAGHPKKQ